MNINDILFCTAHGAGAAFYLTMAMYLLLSTKSLFSDSAPRKELRVQGGITMLCWFGSFVVSLVFYVLNTENQLVTDRDRLLFDFTLLAPATMLLFYRITSNNKMNFLYARVCIFIGLFFFLSHYLTKMEAVYTIALVFWGMVFVYFLYTFYLSARKYLTYLNSEYSDLRHRDLNWLLYCFWFILAYASIYLVSYIFQNKAILFATYFLTTLLWSYVIYNIDTQKSIDLDPKEEEPQPQRVEPVSAPVVEENKTVETVKEIQPEAEDEPVSEDNSWIAEMLEKICVERKLFLHSDITIGGLATAMGSNRTYLWKYFRSKGTSFNVYINTLRVEYAKDLLLERIDLTISEVGKESGFGSDASFRRVFGDLCGCSPSQFAAQNHN